jgi:hypothetical protein
MSVAGPGPASQDPLRAHLASLFGSEEDADCEVAFMRERDPDGEPMHVQPAHKLVIRGMCAFFKAQVGGEPSCRAALLQGLADQATSRSHVLPRATRRLPGLVKGLPSRLPSV